MGIIEDVKADILEGIRITERLVEAVYGAPVEGRTERDDGYDWPFEDFDPDSGLNGSAECAPPEQRRGISVVTFGASGEMRQKIEYPNADSWIVESSNGNLGVVENDEVIATHCGGSWSHVSFDDAAAA